MNFGVSGEMIFLFLLVLILFGPKKMPEIGRQVGAPAQRVPPRLQRIPFAD